MIVCSIPSGRTLLASSNISSSSSSGCEAMSLLCVLLLVEDNPLLLLLLDSASALVCSFFSKMISLALVPASDERDVSKATSSTLPSSRMNLESCLSVDFEADRSVSLSSNSLCPSPLDNAYNKINTLDIYIVACMIMTHTTYQVIYYNWCIYT